MLSRVANCLFWMSRYIERSENIARIVDVNLQLLLDFRDLDEHRLSEHWLPIVQATGDSMIGAGIPEGSLQVVARARKAKHNDIIIAVCQIECE